MKNIKRCYKQLNQFDRDRIEAMLNKKHTQKDIANVLGVDEATISNEIRRNRLKRDGVGAKKGEYKATTAERKSKQRRRFAKYQGKKVEENKELKRYVIKSLKDHWNPDEIAGRMKTDKEPFYISKTAIYEWLHSAYGQRYCKYLPSKRYRIKKRRQGAKRGMIPNRIGIEKRPKHINNKSMGGHFEGDTIVSGKKTKSKFALVVVLDRKHRYTKIKKINNMKPASFNKAILKFKKEIVIKSLTLDNGLENKRWEQLRIPTFFCDPYSSWQKGGVENVNGLIRKYIPKGSDISKYSNNFVKKIETILNNKPRKILNYMTPKEAMEKANLLINNKKTSKMEVALRG